VEEERERICDYEGSDYQKAFWDRGEREYEDRVEAIALVRLMPHSGERLLEVGAGAGRNTPRYRGFRRIILVDFARSQLELARERLGESNRYLYVVADAYHLPFAPEAFDAATMIRTLHHMVDPVAAVGAIRRTLRERAVFILEFANKRNLKAILRYLIGRQDWNPFHLEPVEFAALNFNFHPRAVGKWLVEAGFEIQRQLTVSHFRVSWLKKALPLAALVAMDSVLQWTGKWWQLTPSVFIRAIAMDDPA
jgi:ubiquinone/menaquinone biosynthesis C-methylase UbiE